MSKELIVSSTTHETKVAILENDQLAELYFERERQHALAGSIYKGRVTRVLPGMQSAFVNIGLERDAFLYVSDFIEDTEEYDRVVATAEEKVDRMEKGEAAAAAAAGRSEPVRVEEAEAEAQPPRQMQPPPPAREAGPDRPPRLDRPGFERGERAGGDFGPRGRRHRRRRFGGRGFPESKFVPRSEPRPEPRPEAGPRYAPPPTPAAERPPADFEVLPGESLAKHRRTGEPELPPEPEAVKLQPREEQQAAEPVAEVRVEPVAEVAEPEELEWSAAPAAEAEAEPVELEEVAAEEAEAESVEVEEVAIEQAIAPEAAPVVEEPPMEADDIQPPYPMPPVTEASVRERIYGPRFQHRGPVRNRRGNERPGPRDRDRRFGGANRGPAPVRAAASEEAPARPAQASITDLLKEGQEIIVQIAKEPMGRKGARITSHLALPGRYLVYLPTVDHVGVSRRISSDEERQRLRRTVQGHRSGMPGGFILRTAGEGQSDAEIRADMDFLYNLWLDLRGNAERLAAPALVHADLNLVERILRDQLGDDYKNIWVDTQEEYERIVQFVERFQPSLVGRVKLYTRTNPIFDEFGITPELEKALRPKVWLKSGGYIVINQTEALVAIDINTGKYVGKSNRLEDTIVKINLDAVDEIVRQIRLRDLGGIIVVDFIDMDERKNRYRVMQALDEALKRDRSPSKILQFNDFGLVAITRKRVKQSLERTLCSPCPYCDGSGFVKSVATMIQEILSEARKLAPTIESRDVTLRVNPEVARELKSRNNSFLEEVETAIGRPVLVRSDPQIHQEKFDLN